MWIVTLAALPWLVSAAPPEPPEAHPGYPPTLLRASAVEQAGRVVIRISQPGPVPPEDRKVKPGERCRTAWVPLRPVTLGDTVQAFGVDGQRVKPKAVLKALAKPRGVAVFVRGYAHDPLTPAPFYRALLREGTLILVVNAEDLHNPKP